MDKQMILSLKPDKAQKALLMFYDLTPDSIWEDELKPSPGDIEMIADEIQEEVQKNASEEIKLALSNICSEGNEDIKGLIAKNILQEFYNHHELQPYVTEAVSKATEPSMMPLPLIMVPTIIVLLSIHISYEDGHFNFTYDPNEVIKHLGSVTDLVKSVI